MALIEFKDLPDTTTPLDEDNLNHNFNELKQTQGSSGNWIYSLLPNNFFIAFIPAKQLTFTNGECVIPLPFNAIYNQTSVVAMPVWSAVGDAVIHGSVIDNANVKLQMWDNTGALYSGPNLTEVIVVGIKE